MAVAILPTLNHSVQQHARNLHSQLGQALNSTADTAASSSLDSSASELRLLIASHAKLARTLAGSGPNSTSAPATAATPAAAAAAAAATDDSEELTTACQQRQDLLQDLLQTLDSSVLDLRSHLDACHKLLQTPPCKEDPESIIRYAHTLRHGFAPLGSAPNLPPVPPAPQLPFMLHSTLRLYHMDLAAQQQQAAQQPPLDPAAAAAAAAGAAAAAAGAMQQQPAAPAAAVDGQVAEAQPVPAPTAAAAAAQMQFRLNEDLDEEFDIGETASEEESWSDDDESDTE